MTSGLDPAAVVLAAARRHRAEAEAAERAQLEDAIAWAGLHEPTDPDRAATWGSTPVAITGDGAPLIDEFCIAEFAAALGLRTEAGRQYLADAVELAHRLPRVLEQVRAGRTPVFKARRIAQRTADLTFEGAAFVDHRVAFAASRISLAQVERLVDEARAQFQPDEAAQLAADAAERRHVLVDTRQVSFDGTSQIHAEIDLADALDLEATVSRLATQIAQTHPDLTEDACRAKALGALARGEHAPTDRTLNLVVHLTSDGHGTDQDLDPTAYLETGKRLLALDQIKDWAGTATRVIVRPVIDLHEDLSVTGYAIPDRIAERVTLRDRRCAFPYCERNARHCDTDHTIAYDPQGPPGQTSTTNLAPLCRHHHRLKTHPVSTGSTTGKRWHYVTLEPGVYQWRSPHGLTYLTDITGTRDLTPVLPAPRTDLRSA